MKHLMLTGRVAVRVPVAPIQKDSFDPFPFTRPRVLAAIGRETLRITDLRLSNV